MSKIGFKLERIKTEQFAIIEDLYDDCNEEIDLETSVNFGTSLDNPAIITIIKLQFKQNKNPFLIIEVSCEFSVKKDKWIEFSKGKVILIPKGFLAHLAMITIGTTRGILHSKTDNTKFNEFILPAINVSEMIIEDGKFEKKLIASNS